MQCIFVGALAKRPTVYTESNIVKRTAYLGFYHDYQNWEPKPFSLTIKHGQTWELFVDTTCVLQSFEYLFNSIVFSHQCLSYILK